MTEEINCSTTKEEIFIEELEDYRDDFENQKWKNHEVEIMKKYYGEVPTRKIAEYLDRSISSLHYKAKNLGLKFYDE